MSTTSTDKDKKAQIQNTQFSDTDLDQIIQLDEIPHIDQNVLRSSSNSAPLPIHGNFVQDEVTTENVMMKREIKVQR